MTNPVNPAEELQAVPVADATIEQARTALLDVADKREHVGDFSAAFEVDENVVDFRFVSAIRGYEGWQWSVVMYHDVEEDRWTVNESSLLPTSQALLAPQWIPWKDRLEPSDISPTDVLGTAADDDRLEAGVQENSESNAATDERGKLSSGVSKTPEESSSVNETNSEKKGFRPTGAPLLASSSSDAPASNVVDNAQDSAVEAASESELAHTQSEQDEKQELHEIVDEFELARSRVLSPAGRAATAERWYNGPHGPKSLSTRVAGNNTCQTCGFFVQIKGELGTMFGVCANKWSQDDGRVVSLDHGCGEHSDIEPPAPSTLWVQPEPTVDDDDDIIFVPRMLHEKPSAQERGLADILEDVDDPEDLNEDLSEDLSEDSVEDENAADSDAAQDQAE